MASKHVEKCITCGYPADKCRCGDFVSDRQLTKSEKVVLASKTISEAAEYLVLSYDEPDAENIFGDPISGDREQIAQRIRDLANYLCDLFKC